MKSKLFLLWTLAMLLSISAISQSLSPMVISSSGGFYAAGNTTLSVTVAEMTMVTTFIKPTNMLTQGFQQPEPLTTSLPEKDILPSSVLIYPNPTSGLFNLSYTARDAAEYTVTIYNMVGQIVYSNSFDALTGSNTIELDIRNYTQGLYLLDLSTVSLGKKYQSIHKVNLVY